MNRREFLSKLSAAGIALPALPGMAASIHEHQQANRPAAHTDQAPAHHLILIELQGGNDGLNTLIPFASEQYSQLRPTLAVPRNQVMQLDEKMGLHPSLEALMPLWDQQDIALIQGVGYPEPNRSHFRSIEIWETASDANKTLLDGWLAPLTASMTSHSPDQIKALALAQDEGPLAGSTNNTVVFTDLNNFVKQAKALQLRIPDGGNSALSHILNVENTTLSAARAFAEKLDDENKNVAATLPKRTSKLMKQLDLIARLIREEVGAQVFKVELGSFDTHANQKNRHAALLKQFAEAVAHFEKSLTRSGHWQDVLVMTYSEFGRRVSENGSGGTDHGTAAPHFMLGGSVKGGLFGQSPDLSGLVDNDLAYSVDFRELYSTVSRHWFRQSINDTPFAQFDTLPVIKQS